MFSITQPFVLLRYFSFHDDFYPYSIEKISIKSKHFIRWTETLNFKAFKKTRKVCVNNKTLSFPKVFLTSQNFFVFQSKIQIAKQIFIFTLPYEQRVILLLIELYLPGCFHPLDAFVSVLKSPKCDNYLSKNWNERQGWYEPRPRYLSIIQLPCQTIECIEVKK